VFSLYSTDRTISERWTTYSRNSILNEMWSGKSSEAKGGWLGLDLSRRNVSMVHGQCGPAASRSRVLVLND
jgi:hypothetical protein